MYLFGVTHKQEYFDRQVSKIEEICHVDGKVMMLELAPNYEENVQRGILIPNFSMALAERYRPRCSRVISGDQEITIPENPNWLLSLVMGEIYFYPDNRRDEIMRQTIERERPDIVIVGNGHSDDIKEHFPQVYYTVFQDEGGYTASWSHHGRPHKWYRLDQLITL
ncbi:hypothetical protein HQ545_01490 [Candidatus Woesearchaeota archaeon]|nr:hypothetical protein [Candidatus Woesearchaeota archaeon]